MIGPLNALMRVFYPQNQMRTPAEKVNPEAESAQSQGIYMGEDPARQVLGITNDKQEGLEKSGQDKEKNKKNFDTYECQTCKNRKYQDGSNDPGVSFKTPTKVSREDAPSAVRAHENEHVVREQAKAEREGREVVSQSVTYKTGICPECGRVYIAGGTTRTVTKGQIDRTYGLDGGEKQTGRFLDLAA